jgi:cysteine synthase
VLPENVSPERRQLLEVWGAEIIDSPGEEGSNGAMRRAQHLADEHPEWWFTYQYGNPANPKAHYECTGPEIWRDCPEITHFVAGLGTAGTLMGVGRFLKERNPLMLDRKRIVGPKDSIEWTRRLADVGVFAGISSGAAMAGAAKCAAEIDEGVVVVIVADGGWKYLSTNAWTGNIDEVTERARQVIYF